MAPLELELLVGLTFKDKGGDWMYKGCLVHLFIRYDLFILRCWLYSGLVFWVLIFDIYGDELYR